MTRSTTPTLHCDGDDGLCGAWDVDYYEATVTTVDGVRITADYRAPGWTSDGDSDLCPACASERSSAGSRVTGAGS